MYTPSEHVIIKRRYEFACEPAYGQQPTLRDLTDTIHVALAKLEEMRGKSATQYDDALHLRPTDEGVVLYFDIEDDE